MKIYILLFVLLVNSALFANDTNSTTPEETLEAPVVVKDTSGLSENAVRKKAVARDKQEAKKSPNKQRWEDLSPTPKKHDWVETKSGEWFKGEIVGLYDNALEFDSDEIGDYTFKFDDIKAIKSYHVMSVNIENVAEFVGIIRYKNKTITIIQGDKRFRFPAEQIVSFTRRGETELQNWRGKITLSLDMRSGNKDQTDASLQMKLQRRTYKSRLTFDYLGRYGEVSGVETANDQRFNENYDIYMTRDFYLTPLFSEFYTNKFQNIKAQLKAGLGVGYALIKKKGLEWEISAGPAMLHTEYYNAQNKSNSSSGAFEIGTKGDYDITPKNELIFNYRGTMTRKSSGKYNHHMIISLNNEITKSIDFDISWVWDYINVPQEADDGTVPKRSDYQFLVGVGVDF